MDGYYLIAYCLYNSDFFFQPFYLKVRNSKLLVRAILLAKPSRLSEVKMPPWLQFLLVPYSVHLLLKARASSF